jgi:VanZ family protein
MKAASQSGPRALARWMAVVAWMGVIFYLSAQPSLPRILDRFGMLQSIAGHLLEFTVLALLLRWALDGSGVEGTAAWAFVIAVAYGLFDELHQHFVPGRHTDPVDLLTDAAGAAAALWLTKRVAAHRAFDRQRARRLPEDPG